MRNRVAVITGSASGIGFAIAKTCLQSNMHIVMADSNPCVIEKACELQNQAHGEILPVICDITCTVAVRELVNKTINKFNRIDLLVNNAGISGSIAPFWEQNLTDMKKVIDVNLIGAMNCTYYFLPFLLKQQIRSRIVNIGSVYSLVSGSLLGVYAMSKHALLAFSESLYFDLARLEKPVDVSIACPSFVNTKLLKDSFSNAKDAQKFTHFMQQSSTADEIANYILKEISRGIFYILPNKEVKNFSEQRNAAIISQQNPYKHSLEKIIRAIDAR